MPENMNVNIDKKSCTELVKKLVLDSYGVVGLATPNGVSILSTIFSGIFNKKGVNLSMTEDGLLVDVYIVVEYGNNFKIISKNICDVIKYNLEHFHNLKICSINIHIKGERMSGVNV